MPFPEVPRVQYQRKVLTEVVCDLRFPSILKIDSDSPAAFQNLLRHDYPIYSRTPVLPPNLPAQVAQFLPGFVQQGLGVRHEFRSENGKFKVALTREILDLKTGDYSGWEEFRERMVRLVSALETTYAPGAYNRIGLRYVDRIQRSSVDLSDNAWSSLLRPEITGLLSAAEVADHIDAVSGQQHLRLSDGVEEFLTLKTGLMLAEDMNEKCFVIDSDFHTHGKTEQTNVFNTLDRFNREAGRFFRWCISDRLHNALRPTSL